MITESAIVYCTSKYSEYNQCEFLRKHYYKMIVINNQYKRFSDVHIIDNNNNICDFKINSMFATHIFPRHFIVSLKETRKEKLKKLNLI